MEEGTLSGGSISGTPDKAELWTLDALGNWGGFEQKAAGSTTLDQTRAHNLVNETGAIGATTGTNWADPAYDAAGNMTTMPQPAAPTSSFALKYDAWNRMVEVKDGANLVQENQYDGLNRRVVKKAYSGGSLAETRHYYYNEDWQVVEERVGSDPLTARVDAQYVWQPEFVDSLALRFWDSDADGDLDTYHYYLQDANYNVTAVTDNAGAVVERYAYTPYGEVTVLDDNFSADANGLSDIANVYLYTGRERDPETGLQLNRKRFLVPPLGRWVSRDPISYEGSQWNLYEYAGSSPIINADPSGKYWDWNPINWFKKRPPTRPPFTPRDFWDRQCIAHCNTYKTPAEISACTLICVAMQGLRDKCEEKPCDVLQRYCLSVPAGQRNQCQAVWFALCNNIIKN